MSQQDPPQIEATANNALAQAHPALRAIGWALQTHPDATVILSILFLTFGCEFFGTDHLRASLYHYYFGGSVLIAYVTLRVLSGLEAIHKLVKADKGMTGPPKKKRKA